MDVRLPTVDILKPVVVIVMMVVILVVMAWLGRVPLAASPCFMIECNMWLTCDCINFMRDILNEVRTVECGPGI